MDELEMMEQELESIRSLGIEDGQVMIMIKKVEKKEEQQKEAEEKPVSKLEKMKKRIVKRSFFETLLGIWEE